MKRRLSGSPNHELRGQRGASAIPSGLELVHVTAVGAAREIIAAGQLEPRRCPVFGEDLLYFFVFRPAYRLKEGDQKSDQISRFPVAFVASTEHLPPPRHVYPFDTGGAAAGAFAPQADPWAFLEDYELTPTDAAAAAHIGWAFDNLGDYFSGELKPGLRREEPVWKIVTRSYLSIANMATLGHNRPDDRASAVEVAYRQNVKLKDSVKFAVIPRQYMEGDGAQNDEIIPLLERLGVEWDTYEWQPNLTPNDHKSQIVEVVRRYYERIGRL
jgi:hypothetical protein